ncbi:MAG: hypothetical protein B7Z10_04000 [Rhodobacterales bacterium 32-66-7]|nr:MAG: hypothetical protein B7Z10_04000 [Rhodobacterales bacterium 32-66-7]
MRAEGITIAVTALDRIRSPRPGARKGWAAALAKARVELHPGSVEVLLTVSHQAGHLGLAEAVGAHPAGTAVEVEAVPGLALCLIRLAGKPFGIACPGGVQPELAVTGGPADPDHPPDPAALSGFVAGTLIETPDGPRACETLRAGDLVSTLANGSRPLEWVARRRVSVLELLAHPGLRPLVIARGVAGNDRELWLSPRQRLLIDDWRAEVFFGEDRVLAAAEALAGGSAVSVALPPDGVEYVLLLCDRHEILQANGALSESFHPGETGLAGLTVAERTAL